MKIIQGGVTAAKGFLAAGAMAEIKYSNRKDMAMIYSIKPCKAAGTFTSNVVKAAPVLWDKDVVDNSQYAQAVVVNAGIANACTGKKGYSYCEETAKATAEKLGIPAASVLVASTGVIGMQLPIDRIIKGIDILADSLGDTMEFGTTAAQAIMTTDTISKEAAVTVEIGNQIVTIGGMSKGSGMIHPDMCTMLGFVTTDCNISKELMQKALREDVKDSFNMISVDGDTSTNDTLLLLANGEAGNELIADEDENYHKFCEALKYVTTTLAKMMAGDGEGATALIEAQVIHANDKQQARLLAKSVICSSLTKAAVFGHDANWGRIMCAMGYSGAQFDPENVDLYYVAGDQKILLYSNGEGCDYSEEEATKLLSNKEVTILIDMKEKDATATAWGCDLTYDYVKINADYRS